MFKNYLTTAIRNLLRFKLYSFINVTGLVIGFTSCFLILLFVQDELSYDKYNKNAARIYRLTDEVVTEKGNTSEVAVSSAPMGPALLANYPEVENYVRFYKYSNKATFTYGTKNFLETKFFFADSSVFNIFTWHMLEGDPNTALTEPYSVVITKSIARKYFGNEDPIGKTLIFNHWKEFTVTGVVQDIPSNSHFTFNLLGSFSTLNDFESLPQQIGRWDQFSFYTYLLLRRQSSAKKLEIQLPKFIGEHISIEGLRILPHLEPLTSIHLHSQLEYDISPQGNIIYVHIFTAIAFLLVLIASINFVNLSMARADTRVKEVGLRKVVGAYRSQLIEQFIGESVLLSLLSLVCALGLTEFFLPVLNFVAGKNLELDIYQHFGLIMFFIGIALIVGVITGAYPAFVLSSFKPAKTFKARIGIYSRGSLLRKALVALQFTISVALSICAYLIFIQLKYTQSKQLGFDKENLIVLPTMWNHDAFETELLKNPNISSATVTNALPGVGVESLSKAPGVLVGTLGGKPVTLYMFWADFDFAKTLKLNFVAGRNFSVRFPTDSSGFILNEDACRKFGFTSPSQIIGRQLSLTGYTGPIVGVVKDFNFESLHQQVEPVVITPTLHGSDAYIAIRISSNAFPSTLDFIKEKWRRFAPDVPFEYSFISDDLSNLYKADYRAATVFGYFSIVGILIACLGVFGLAAFSLERRFKEIAIRKVMGASVADIVTLLSKESLGLLLLGNVVAWPVSYLIMSNWLESFAYRANMTVAPFIGATFVVSLIVLVTGNVQILRIAWSSPASSLRYE